MKRVVVIRRAKLETVLINTLCALQDPENDYFRTRRELRQQFGGVIERFGRLLETTGKRGDKNSEAVG